jgi:hypothetical protein
MNHLRTMMRRAGYWLGDTIDAVLLGLTPPKPRRTYVSHPHLRAERDRDYPLPPTPDPGQPAGERR